MNKSLKERDLITVLNTKYTKIYASQSGMVKNIVDGHMGLLKPGWISEASKFREPEFYKLVTTLAFDDDNKKYYTVSIGRCNQLKKNLRVKM